MIAVELSRLLNERDKSLYWLAQQTGIRYATLHRLATKPVDKVSLALLNKICDALGCELSELLVRK